MLADVVAAGADFLEAVAAIRVLKAVATKVVREHRDIKLAVRALGGVRCLSPISHGRHHGMI